MTIIERILCRFFLMVDINQGPLVYLRRWFLGYHPTSDFLSSPPKLVVKWYHRLLNWLLKGKDVQEIYLHKMFLSDGDRAPHTHSWSFRTRILWNGYNDEHYAVMSGSDGSKVRLGPFVDRLRFMSSRYRPTSWIHQVKKHNERPTWTLVKRSKAERLEEWGFVLPDGRWVHWQEFLGVSDPGNPFDPPQLD
jgi:hypothetical protein